MRGAKLSKVLTSNLVVFTFNTGGPCRGNRPVAHGAAGKRSCFRVLFSNVKNMQLFTLLVLKEKGKKEKNLNESHFFLHVYY